MTGFLDAKLLRDRWPQVGFGELRIVSSTGSTNADAAAAAHAGAAPGLVIVATHQATGRGRFARRWEAPPDTSLAMSVLVSPSRPVAEWGWLSLVVGMAACDGIRDVTGLPVGLKWPNDVLLDGRKLCGILSERVLVNGRERAVLGIGINVAQTRAQLPIATASSLRLEGSDAPAADVAVGVLSALARRYAAWDAGESLVADYRAQSLTIGCEVAIHVGEQLPVTGTAVDIDAFGRLLVATATGHRAFAAGDVVHLRRP